MAVVEEQVVLVESVCVVQEWRLTGKEMAGYRGSRARKGQAIAAKLKPTALIASD